MVKRILQEKLLKIVKAKKIEIVVKNIGLNTRMPQNLKIFIISHQVVMVDLVVGKILLGMENICQKQQKKN